MLSEIRIKFLLVLLAALLFVGVTASENGLDTSRVRRGAAYAGAYGPASPKLSPTVALGTYGGHLNQPHAGGGYRKQTVQEALGAYGGFVQGGHQGPTVIGNGGSLFNKGH